MHGVLPHKSHLFYSRRPFELDDQQHPQHDNRVMQQKFLHNCKRAAMTIQTTRTKTVNVRVQLGQQKSVFKSSTQLQGKDPVTLDPSRSSSHTFRMFGKRPKVAPKSSKKKSFSKKRNKRSKGKKNTNSPRRAKKPPLSAKADHRLKAKSKTTKTPRPPSSRLPSKRSRGLLLSQEETLRKHFDSQQTAVEKSRKRSDTPVASTLTRANKILQRIKKLESNGAGGKTTLSHNLKQGCVCELPFGCGEFVARQSSNRVCVKCRVCLDCCFKKRLVQPRLELSKIRQFGPNVELNALLELSSLQQRDQHAPAERGSRKASKKTNSTTMTRAEATRLKRVLLDDIKQLDHVQVCEIIQNLRARDLKDSFYLTRIIQTEARMRHTDSGKCGLKAVSQGKREQPRTTIMFVGPGLRDVYFILKEQLSKHATSNCGVFHCQCATEEAAVQPSHTGEAKFECPPKSENRVVTQYDCLVENLRKHGSLESLLQTNNLVLVSTDQGAILKFVSMLLKLDILLSTRHISLVGKNKERPRLPFLSGPDFASMGFKPDCKFTEAQLNSLVKEHFPRIPGTDEMSFSQRIEMQCFAFSIFQNVMAKPMPTRHQPTPSNHGRSKAVGMLPLKCLGSAQPFFERVVPYPLMQPQSACTLHTDFLSNVALRSILILLGECSDDAVNGRVNWELFMHFAGTFLCGQTCKFDHEITRLIYLFAF